MSDELRIIERAETEGALTADQIRWDPVRRLTPVVAQPLVPAHQGCLTMLKLKTRGTQRIVVQQQQVNVGPGGQAVVAGRLNRGSRRTGRRRKNGQSTP